MKVRKFAFRLTVTQYYLLKQKSKKAKMTMTDFIISTITEKEIVIIEGVNELHQQLKLVGNNLNQLTTLANMGKIDAVYLSETKLELAKIYDKLSNICAVKTNGNS
jgi:hypothetical protein